MLTMPPLNLENLDIPKDGPVADAMAQFTIHNMMLGAEILRDAAHHAVVKAAKQRGWPCETQDETYDAIGKMDNYDLNLMASYLHANGMPDKIRYRYGDIIPGEIEMDCWAIGLFLGRMQQLTCTGAGTGSV